MAKVALVICGGFHPPSYTAQILAIVARDPLLCQMPVIMADAVPLAPLSGQALRATLERSFAPEALASTRSGTWPELIIWAFSAGCLGAAALAYYWQGYRASVRAMFWVDGWGVPWGGDVPLHRLSHDLITYRATGGLGLQQTGFVATPAVSHQRLWQSPEAVPGRQVGLPTGSAANRAQLPQLPQRLNAAEFLCGWSRHYLQGV